ncbi:MAG: metallophosphoesterase [Flavobacteriales bacterium]|nr:metallophosphoesterase [Flavobacteriales bacterium]
MSLSLMFRLTLVLLVLFLIDWYAWRGIHTAMGLRGAGLQRGVRIGYWAVSLGMLAVIVFGMVRMGELRSSHNDAFLYTVLGIFVLLLLPKLVIILFHGLEDLLELFRWGWSKLAPGAASAETDRGRIRFLSQLGLALAAIPFSGVLYGLTRGWRNFNVAQVAIKAPKLPKAFDGLRIVQISDMHLGSFSTSTDVVQHGIDLINAQKPDLILFTGDLVNNFAEEVEPWLETVGQLHAPLGKFSILGNHDYGDYSSWPSAGEKAANLEQLKAHHRTMGFRLLLDEHVPIEKDGERFSLIGVQNWGTRFQQYGNLSKAIAGTDPAQFRLLMSHDPTHWDAQVRATGIDLMLAGHTHGAQFGITINGHTYSPAQWIYEEWAGLYKKNGQQLYVNRGFGYIGFPGRVGMPPEITVVTLSAGSAT